MRPCAISSSCMLGMLESTLVVLRGDQKPSLITTALTGTVLRRAYGEFESSMTPVFFQFANGTVDALFSAPRKESNCALRGKERAPAVGATAAAVATRKDRREKEGCTQTPPRFGLILLVLRRQVNVSIRAI